MSDGPRLFGSTLDAGEDVLPRGLRWAGVLMLASAALALITAVFAPRYGLGSRWSQLAWVAVDTVMGVSLVMRRERFAVVVIVRAVAGLLFFTVIAIRAQSFVLLAIQSAFSVGLLLLLVGYPKTWRIALGLAIAGVPLMLGTFVVQSRMWTELSDAVEMLATGKVQSIPGGVVRGDAHGYTLRLPGEGWSEQKLHRELKRSSPSLDAWLVRPDVGAHVLVFVRNGMDVLSASDLEARAGAAVMKLPKSLEVQLETGTPSTHAFDVVPIIDHTANGTFEGNPIGVRTQFRAEYGNAFLLVGFAAKENFEQARPIIEQAFAGFDRSSGYGAWRTAAAAAALNEPVARSLVLVFSGMKQAAGVVLRVEGNSATAAIVSAKFAPGERVTIAHLSGDALKQSEGTITTHDPATNVAAVRFEAANVRAAQAAPEGESVPEEVLLVGFIGGMPRPHTGVDPVRLSEADDRFELEDVGLTAGLPGAAVSRPDGKLVALGALSNDPRGRHQALKLSDVLQRLPK